MSPIFLPAVTHTHTPFCDQRFKRLRLTGNYLLKVCLSIFCTAIFYLTRCLSKKISDEAQLWSKIYSAQSHQLDMYLKLYLSWGNEVIDFSSNFSPRLQKKTMEETYGKEMIERCTQAALPFGSIQASKLKPIQEGWCFGISLDFISTYLHEVQKGIPPSNAIRSASLRVREGASKEAELAQILGEALVDSSADRVVQIKMPVILNSKEDEEALAIGKNIFTHPTGVSPFYWNKITERLLSAIKKELEQAIVESRRFRAYRDYGSSLFGLVTQTSIGHYLLSSERTKKPPQAYLDWMDQLKTGAYKLMLNSPFDTRGANQGHGLALIKTADKTYFFDSNYATLAIDPKKSAERIWAIFQNYLRGIDLLISATPLSLA